MWLQDYKKPKLIDGVELRPRNVNITEDGEFCEIIRPLEQPLPFQVRQQNYALNASGSIKAYHLHKTQWDAFFPFKGLIVNLLDIRPLYRGYRWEELIGREDWAELVKGLPHNRIYLDKQILIIPPGVLHGIGNPYKDDRVMMYFVSETFDHGREEWRVPFDAIGKEVWDIRKG